MEDDEMYDPPWEDDLYLLPTTGAEASAKKAEKERQEAEEAFAEFARARLAEAAANHANQPPEPDDKPVEVDWECGNAKPFIRKTAAADRRRSIEKIRSARLSPESADWLIQQIRLDQIAKTDQLIEAGRLRPFDPGEYLHALQHNAIAAGAPLSQAQLIEMTNACYSHWLQENSKPRRERPRRPRPDGGAWELITNPSDKQCGYVDSSGYFCALYHELSLTVICRTCGKVPAQVCLEHFDHVLMALEDERLFCTADTPGNHQVIHIVEGWADVASS